jgi:hypothetical protein
MSLMHLGHFLGFFLLNSGKLFALLNSGFITDHQGDIIRKDILYAEVKSSFFVLERFEIASNIITNLFY